jgi:SAM-dependent methyltransferase
MKNAVSYPGTELEVLASAVEYSRWIVDSFRPYIEGRVAEVGAGMGTVSQLLLKCDTKQLIAYEPSSNLFPVLSRRLSEEPRATATNSTFRPDATVPFDTVVYVNVLEHIEDDASEVQTAYAALRPGGHLLVFVPALPWLYSEFDRSVQHFRRYTHGGLKNLVLNAGFEVISSRYFDVAGILPWYVNFVLLKNRPAMGSVQLYDRLVVPIMRRVESLVTPPLGKNVFLVARKPGAGTGSMVNGSMTSDL